ncbi:MAG: tetratricopeptide repeat protein [Clostridia bacterium]|nr:tetratricopeptide repeat protein [Clostridia bacterium]
MHIIEDLERKLEQLLKEPGNPHLFNQIGVLLYEVEDWQSANVYFQRGYELSPQDQDILYNYAALLYQQAQWQQAIPIYQAYLEAQPEDKEVLQRVGDIYYLLGEYEEAGKKYLRAGSQKSVEKDIRR